MHFQTRWPVPAGLAHRVLAHASRICAGYPVLLMALLVLLVPLLVLCTPSLVTAVSHNAPLLHVAEARAEDSAHSLELPTVPGQRLATSWLWRQLETHAQDLPPTWQRRCQELHSIAVDTDTIGQHLPPQLSELKSTFLKAQQKVVYLLLDLAPTTMEASDNHALIVRLEEWEWFLAGPVRQVALAEQELATYAGVLREVGEALARPRTADTPANAALLGVLPEVRSLHALLEARVAYLESTITPWLRPARAMQTQIRTALENTLRVQPQLWLNYYTLPQRLSRLSFERAPLDFENLLEALMRGEMFLRPMVLSALLASFVLGCFIVLLRTAQKICADPALPTLPAGNNRPTGQASLWHVLCVALHTLSWRRKVALAVGGVCVASIFLDALPQIHTHIPFVRVHMCVLLAAVAVWAKNAKNDPPLATLVLPVVAGFVLLEGDASAVWMMGGMSVALLTSLLVMPRILNKQRRAALPNVTASPFYGVWVGTLVLGLLLTCLGFGRVAALLVGAVLFCRAAFVVLWILYHIKELRSHPLRLSLLMPLMVGWLYSLGLVVGLGYPGADALWNFGQAHAMQLFGVQFQLSDVLLLLALGLGLLVFGSVSRQMLHQAARQRKLLDSSAVPVIHAVVNSLLWVLFTLFGLGLLGVDMRSLAFIGGALTVGLGLGLQGIISNFFSGLVIIFARVVRGGDVIEVGNVRGRVHSVNMRATVLEMAEGAILLVPNGEMLNSRLINWTRNNRHVRADINLRLALPLDVQSAMAMLEAVAVKHADILTNPAPVAFLLKSDEGVVDVALQVWVADVDSKRAILSALQVELCRALVERGVNLAVPPTDVVVKTVPQGQD